nr:MAG: hypothetical protein [flactilig virus 18]
MPRTSRLTFACSTPTQAVLSGQTTATTAPEWVTVSECGVSVQVSDGLWTRLHRWAYPLRWRFAAAGAACVTVGALLGGVRTGGALTAGAALALASALLPASAIAPSREIESECAGGLGLSGLLLQGTQTSQDENFFATAFVREWVMRAKLRFGEVSTKPADVICLKKWLAEEMARECPDLRLTDKARFIPMIAVLAGVPDANDIRAHLATKTKVVMAAKVLGGGGEK